MPSSSPSKHEEHTDAADFAKRYETLGNRDEAVQPSTGSQRRRTIEDCVRETEEQRLLGIEVITGAPGDGDDAMSPHMGRHSAGPR